MPDLGEGIAEGELVKWLVREGDTVAEHQELVEIETDKALVRVPSPRSGKILSLNAKQGENVQVGNVLCTIGEPGESAKTASAVKLEVKSASVRVSMGPTAKKGSSTVIGELEEAPD